MRILIATLSCLFAACLVLVWFINQAPVTVVLWPATPEYTYPETSVGWVIFLSAFAGAVFMGVIALLEGSKIRLSNARLRNQMRKLQQEVEILRRPSLDLSLTESRSIDSIPIDLEAETDAEAEEERSTG